MQSRPSISTPAVFSESLMTECIHCLWCLAVSCGRKPSPGGVMYVCLTLDKTMVDPSVSCLMIPAPSLLAEPSRPSAMYGHSKRGLRNLRLAKRSKEAYLVVSAVIF